MRVLEARGWIDIVGHRESPGRPALFSTTRAFLDDLNLRSLDELPPLEELGALIEDEGDALEEEVHGIAEGNLEGVASEMAEAGKAEVMTTVASDAAALPVEREGDDGSPIEARALT